METTNNNSKGQPSVFDRMKTNPKWKIVFLEDVKGEIHEHCVIPSPENEKIIASAPLLLEALQQLTAWVVENTSQMPPSLINANAAIKSATE